MKSIESRHLFACALLATIAHGATAPAFAADAQQTTMQTQVAPAVASTVSGSGTTTGPVTTKKSLCQKLESGYDFWAGVWTDYNAIKPPTSDSKKGALLASGGMSSHYDAAYAAGCAWADPNGTAI